MHKLSHVEVCLAPVLELLQLIEQWRRGTVGLDRCAAREAFMLNHLEIYRLHHIIILFLDAVSEHPLARCYS